METTIGLIISLLVNLFLISLLMKKKKAEQENNITEEGIRQMVDAGGDMGSIDETEKEMINNIFDLSNISVGEIATHRTDIVAIPLDATLEDITNVITEEKYSRIVVYDESIDNIVGVFHVKDMVKYILGDAKRMEEDYFHIEDILMTPYFVPFSKKTDELFQEMQKEKVHMAIVIDEYGGTAGIVTMEDVIEEIVGNIFDEYDVEEEEDICPIGEDDYRINGTTDLGDVEELLGIAFEDDEDYDTLGGYLIGRLGRIPDEEEKPEISVSGWLFQVESIEEKRIEKVRTIRAPEEQAEEERRLERNRAYQQKQRDKKKARQPEKPRKRSLKELAKLDEADLTPEEAERLAAHRQKKAEQHKAWRDRQKAAQPPKPQQRTLKELAECSEAGLPLTPEETARLEAHRNRKKAALQDLKTRAETDPEAAAELARQRAYQSEAVKKSRLKMYEDAAAGDAEAQVRYERMLAARRENYHRKKQAEVEAAQAS